MEEENRSLRLRLEGSSSGPPGYYTQQKHQEAAQSTQADSSSNLLSRATSSATTPLSWTGDDLPAEGGGGPPSKHNQLLGLTSASILEDMLGKLGEDQDDLAHSSTGSFPIDSEHLSQRLEAEAAKQRAYSFRLRCLVHGCG